MIIVTGVIELEAAGIDKARAAAVDMMRETRKEDGCLVYEFSQLIENPNQFRVYEEWANLTALEAHFDAPHMGVFRAALGEVGVVSRNVVRMEAGEKTSLG
ncbi:MAG: putative quinol monooxygenase [Paracoccaceae bacterium]